MGIKRVWVTPNGTTKNLNIETEDNKPAFHEKRMHIDNTSKNISVLERLDEDDIYKIIEELMKELKK